MVGTSAGKAGFITGLYIVIVPLIGLFIRQKTSQALWTGSLLALAGLFLLTINRNFAIEKGDFFILLSAFFWAAHVQLINKLVKSLPPLKLSIIQFLVCSVLSILTASCYESMEISGLRQAIIPLLYGGIASVGVAYTLQVFAQQHVHPAYAALILSFEMVFAALGGWLILHETLTIQNLAGCVLMLSGVVVVQTPLLKKRKE
jgi:drug/metabolite transporter (DMT)-like permease